MADDFSNFDVDAIDQAAAAYMPPESKSQRAEARKLRPLIERVLALNPKMRSSAVIEIITNAQTNGAMPTTATFKREFGRICDEVRRAHEAAANKKKAAPKKVAPSAKATSVGSDTASNVTASVTAAVVTEPLQVERLHPLSLYTGRFVAKTFVFGNEIREFFKAIERREEDAVLKALARSVMQTASASARLGELHPADRAILDAALALS